MALAGSAWAQTEADRAIPPAAPAPAPVPVRSGWRTSPNDGEPYAPLTVKEKAYLFGWRSIAPSSWMKSAVSAGLAHWQNSPEEWEQGPRGYGIRYGHRMANRGVESVIGFGVSTALGQDARYFRKPNAGVKTRLLHAMSQAILTRKDDGGITFSAWRVGGNYGAQFVSNVWRPERQRGFGDTMLRGTYSVGYDAASNIFKEFWPDIKRKIFKR